MCWVSVSVTLQVARSATIQTEEVDVRPAPLRLQRSRNAQVAASNRVRYSIGASAGRPLDRRVRALLLAGPFDGPAQVGRANSREACRCLFKSRRSDSPNLVDCGPKSGRTRSNSGRIGEPYSKPNRHQPKYARSRPHSVPSSTDRGRVCPISSGNRRRLTNQYLVRFRQMFGRIRLVSTNLGPESANHFGRCFGEFDHSIGTRSTDFGPTSHKCRHRRAEFDRGCSDFDQSLADIDQLRTTRDGGERRVLQMMHAKWRAFAGTKLARLVHRWCMPVSVVRLSSWHRPLSPISDLQR